MSDPDIPTVLERCAGVCGELTLLRRGARHEIVANGVFLMDTRETSSERLLVTAAAERMPARGRMLIGGLGVGFSLVAALNEQRVRELHVVEREAAVIRWNLGPLAAVHGDALRDPRTHVHEADIVGWLADAPTASLDALCLDVDNGPDWLVTAGNAALYTGHGLATAARVLAPGGVLALWSAARADAFAVRMRERFTDVTTLEVPVTRGEPDVVVLGQRIRDDSSPGTTVHLGPQFTRDHSSPGTANRTRRPRPVAQPGPTRPLPVADDRPRQRAAPAEPAVDDTATCIPRPRP